MDNIETIITGGGEIKPSLADPTFSLNNWFKPSSKVVIVFATFAKSVGYLIGAVGMYKSLILFLLVGGGIVLVADLIEKLTKGEPVSVIKSVLNDIVVTPSGIVTENYGTDSTTNAFDITDAS